MNYEESLLIIFLLLTKIAFATNLQDARKQALDFGSGFKESANQTISEKNKINTFSKYSKILSTCWFIGEL